VYLLHGYTEMASSQVMKNCERLEAVQSEWGFSASSSGGVLPLLHLVQNTLVCESGVLASGSEGAAAHPPQMNSLVMRCRPRLKVTILRFVSMVSRIPFMRRSRKRRMSSGMSISEINMMEGVVRRRYEPCRTCGRYV
jgi:hypothetical protein